jgi:L-histidine N-alpha-methyltransferase
MIENFARDVLDGLTSSNKYLKSCYLYNPKGDRLFQEKMAMSEYYLTSCEYAIFLNHKDDIMNIFSNGSEKFNLIELGAGDGHKTKIILANHVKNNKKLTYIPIDISENILTELKCDLVYMYPNLHINPIVGDYISALKTLAKSEEKCKNIVIFIGSTIGNFLPSDSEFFLQEVASCLNSGDIMLIGFDMKKSPQVIRDAYTLGPNESFYKNILERINEELKGNFDLANFEHYFSYNPIDGLGETFLISKKEQIVKLLSLDVELHFKSWEPIRISLHQKYDDEYIKELAEKTGFEVIHSLYDNQKYFSNSIWRLK